MEVTSSILNACAAAGLTCTDKPSRTRRRAGARVIEVLFCQRGSVAIISGLSLPARVIVVIVVVVIRVVVIIAVPGIPAVVLTGIAPVIAVSVVIVVVVVVIVVIIIAVAARLLAVLRLLRLLRLRPSEEAAPWLRLVLRLRL